MRRPVLALSLVLAVASTGCAWLQTPCGRVANAICTVPGEAASCEFLRGVQRDNELAQSTCEKLESPAKAYAQAPDSLLHKGGWAAASVALRAAGFVGEATKPTPQQKIERAGRKLGDGIREAGEALGDAIDDAIDSVK